jgi:SAM-dependent methyltransferase
VSQRSETAPRASAYVDRMAYVVDSARGRRVLDCGVVGETCDETDARVEAIVSSLHFRVVDAARAAVGVDYASDAVARLRERYPRLDLRACDVETIDVALAGEEPFDLVILGDLVEHLGNPGRALDAVRNVLTADGSLLVTTPNAFGLPNILRFAAGRYREGDDHVASYSKFTLGNLLRRHGFRVERVLTALDRPPRSRRRRILYRLGAGVLRRVPEVGGTLIVVARRAA